MRIKGLSSNKKAVIVFLFFFVALYLLQFRVPEIIGYDGYLHIKVADLTKNGIIREFPWTTESILKDSYADHQFLFRLVLIPFTFMGMMYGAKLASVLLSALCFTIFYWYLKKNNLNYPFVWTFTYAVSSVFLMSRFLLPRPMPLTVTALILTLHFIQTKKYLYLAITTFLITWLSPSFIFQLMIIALYLLISLLTKKKLNLKLMLYPTAALILALLLNPYFPKDISLLYIQLFKVNLMGNLYNQEWRAWPVKEFFMVNYILLSLLTLSITAKIKDKKLNKHYLSLALSTIIFLIFTITSRRMQEFFAPFAILLAAFSLNSVIKNKKVIIAITTILILITPIQILKLNQKVDEGHFLPRYKEGVLWMKENIPEGSKVFINGYTFSYLFFYNENLYYTHGVDLTYSHLQNKTKFETYMNILKGNYPGYNAIKLDYLPDYVFIGKTVIDKNLAGFIIKYKDDYEILYEGENTAVFKVVYKQDGKD